MRVILVGGGPTVYFLARQFCRKQYHVTVINRNVDECREISDRIDALVVHGDGSSSPILEDAGARRADVVLALTHHDQDNLVICQTAQRMFGVPRTIALVNDPENEAIFHRLGVTIAFSATRVIANLLEEQTDFDEITSLIALDEGRITVGEVIIRADAPAAQKSIAELGLPVGVLIGSVIRGDEFIIPGGATHLQPGDRLILISRPEQHEDALRILVGNEE
jgi:trk system potassium uptake protein TrkA